MYTIDNKAKKFTFILMAIGLVSLIFGFVTDYLHYQEDQNIILQHGRLFYLILIFIYN